MKPKNLEFYEEVDGRKPHYIFIQDDVFYVFTLMDEDKRGNFCVISNHEVNRVRKRIAELNLELFHPKEIDLYRYMAEESHREHRLRSICYILVASRELNLVKVARELHFRVVKTVKVSQDSETKPLTIIKTIQKTFKKPTEYDYYNDKLLKNVEGDIHSLRPKVLCPFCKIMVKKNKIDSHVRALCPKRPVQ